MPRDSGPWPRHYAAHIVSLPTLAERRAAFDKVPKEWRELVKKQVEIAWNHPSRKEPHGQQTDR
ncbi:hypothetical protein D6Z43_16365 [Pseudomonas sp. DY-1]|uniref:hypothetical protein n=1 Tax=Pseudomonas sp. DY-1 TaxID=1755504 RepID=UPI000EA84E19|nr:hypothetical protein [Pseudomonas sp. DY-1]AYF88643.1 hypothetical protein D6Z43_16365 [Pseudomonas sp. DY-1]